MVQQPTAKAIEKETKVNKLENIKKVKSGGLNGPSKLNLSKSVDGLLDQDFQNKKKKEAKNKAKFFVAPIPRWFKVIFHTSIFCIPYDSKLNK